MLIRDDGDSWTAITQPAHAFLAGQVARAWTPPLDADTVLGIEQHDVVWIEWDREPPLLADARRAAAFFEAPLERRLQMWTGAAARMDAQSPYAALLVSLHATNIHARYFPEGQRPEQLLAEQRADQDALLALLPGVTRAQAERDADLLFAVDSLSLTLCNGWPARDLPEVDGVAIHVEPDGDGAAALDPWPLGVDELTVGVHARRLTERFDDEAEMHRVLAATPYERLTWRLHPATLGT